MEKVWSLVPPPEAWPAEAHHFHPLERQLLANRGIVDDEAIREFLSPMYETDIHDPFLFRDMANVAKRIETAISKQESLALFGDYDADGVCSSVVLAKTLGILGAKVEDVYLPHREKEGYGLNETALRSFRSAGVTLVITLDCGTTNVAEILLAKELGMDVIVIDHHHVPESLPGAFALLNPKMPEEQYPFRYLASVGMAFKVSQALLKRASDADESLREKYQAFEKWLLDLVAIATVTDMVPLKGENRTLLKYGLTVLNRTSRVGLRELVKAMGAELGSLDAYDIGFGIGPRINAAGRMNHANAAFELLMCTDSETAVTLAKNLNQENVRRQASTEEIATAALTQLGETPAGDVLVAVGEGWPVGLVGLVASRVVERFGKPALILGKSDAGVTGSGRSIQGFDMIAALHTMPDLFLKFGGHAQACGFTLAPGVEADDVRKRLNAYAREHFAGEDVRPVLTIDATIRLKDIQRSTWEMIERFAPFGMENPRPKFLLPGVRVVGMGTVGATGQHLKLTVSDNEGTVRQAIGFRLGDRQSSLRLGDSIDIVTEVQLNRWNGSEEVQLKLIDLRLSL